MKVILLQEVPKIGHKHEVKTVADGFGRNFLLARGLAMVATAENLKKLQVIQARQAGENKLREELLQNSLSDLKGVTIKLAVKASPEGHLFAGIHQIEIAAALKKQTQLDLDPTLIQLDKPIKQVGEYDIPIKVGDKTGHFKLVIEAI